MPEVIEKYLSELARVDPTGATEFTYRTPLENLFVALTPEGFEVVQEPTRTQGIGAPDFRITEKIGAIVGYVECKKPGDDLSALAGSEQVRKYRNLSPNILLTDYWEFHLLGEGATVPPASLRDSSVESRSAVEELLRRFLDGEPQRIGSAKDLAGALAERCRILRTPLAEGLGKDREGRLRGMFGAFRKTIYRDIDEVAFADALAQTLVYGLLIAKLNMESGDLLELHNVKRHIPQNFQLLREIAGFLDELDAPSYASVKYLVDDILAIVTHMDVAAVAESLSYNGGKTDDDDPYLYFYENFLAAYDAKLRETRGVYYTPPPVVRFIVNAANDILRRDFGLRKGFADSTVTALDFATGTGTFMLEMFKLVFGNKSPAKRDMLAHSHLLKNFFGFELLLAPFAIAHLKLSQFLKDKKVNLDGRVNVFLANTLEHTIEIPELPFMPALAHETKCAKRIKKHNILVIVGNPPYSGNAQTPGKEEYERRHKRKKGETVKAVRATWIGGLLKDYYKVDGKPLDEHNPRMLQDDYVKFIRFAQHKIEAAHEGIVAVITNHAFLDNLTFRGMRQSLMQSFDRLYFLDLHGSARRQEATPDSVQDENVFDIQQGVAVSLFVKKEGLSKGVFRADLFGKRVEKYKWCEEQNIDSVEWERLSPASPFYFFRPWDSKKYEAYCQHWIVEGIFEVSRSGIKTHRDKFAFAYDRKTIHDRIDDMVHTELSDDEFQKKHNAKETRDWKLAAAREECRKCENIDKGLVTCAYRPFDSRWCFYGRETMDLPRPEVMHHMLEGGGLGLMTVRQSGSSDSWRHCFIVNQIAECCYISNKSKEAGYLFPLYRRDNEMGNVVKRENISLKFRDWIDEHYGERHPPEKILGYIYAVLHSSEYRQRYAEFLRVEFPRIPFSEDKDEFLRLANIGEELMNAHLLQTSFGEGAELCGEGTTHRVNRVRYDETAGKLYFNPDEYFAPLSPDVYNFFIGGYRPLDQFLKSRKGRELSADEVLTIEQAARAISFTLSKQQEIDEIIHLPD